MRATVLVLLLASVISPILSAEDGIAPITVWSGVYTEAQAQRGKAAFEKKCVLCHNIDLNGNRSFPALHGDRFLADWWNTSVGIIFRKIRDTMPDIYPDTVDPETKLDILSYILQQNNFPPAKPN